MRLPPLRIPEHQAGVKSVLNMSLLPRGETGLTLRTFWSHYLLIKHSFPGAFQTTCPRRGKSHRPMVDRAMDDNDQPVNRDIGSATQVVDFATSSSEVSQPQNVHTAQFPPGPKAEVVQPLLADSHVTLEAPENKWEAQSSDDQIVPIDTQEGTTPGQQDRSTQPTSKELHQTLEISEIREARLNLGDEVPPDELPPASKGKDAEKFVLPVGPESRTEETENLSSPVEPRVPSPVHAPIGGNSAENITPLVTPAPKKKLIERLPAGIRQWPFGDASGKKTNDLNKTVLKKDDQKRDPKTDDQKKDIQKEQNKDDQKKNQRNDDLKEPEVSQKGLGGTELKETEKAPASVSTIKTVSIID
jgi:hypothetical protein